MQGLPLVFVLNKRMADLRLQKKFMDFTLPVKLADSIISICPINALDVLITDDDALEEYLKAIEENGVEILLTV